MPNDKDKEWIDPIIRKTIYYIQNGGQFDMSLQVTIPNEWEKITPINIGYTAGIETTKVAPQWIEKSFLMDKILTISHHSKNVYLDTVYDATVNETQERVKVGCQTPIEVVHYPVRNYKAADIDLELDYDFNFLTVAQWGPRKNLDNTVQWWVEEFLNEEVGLVVKTNLIKSSLVDREFTEKRLSALLSAYPDRKCKVYLVHGYMTPEEMTGIYQHPQIKCLVSLTHGEGFGLPLFEAAYNGMPIIAPDWSGHVDFLHAPRKTRKKKKTVTKVMPCYATVKYDLREVQKTAVWDGVVQSDAKWCYPQEASYKKQLRNVHTNYGRFTKIAQTLKKHIAETFEPKIKYEAFANAVYEEEKFEMEDWLNSLDIETYE